MVNKDFIMTACINDLMSGIQVEEIADKYFECATLELRDQLISELVTLREMYEARNIVKSILK